MNEPVTRALATDRTIDITTTGRRTGRPRRLEIWFHNLDGMIYLSGSPGPRDWYANLLADPSFTFHLKRSTQADLPARAVPILKTGERRSILSRIAPAAELDEWVKRSPLVRVTFEPD